MNLARQVVDVHLDLVEAVRRHGESHEPIHPNDAAPARGQRQRVQQAARAYVLRLGALTGVAGADIFGNVPRLPRPKREAPNQGGRLVPAEMPSEGCVVALPKDTLSEIAPVRDTQAVRFGLAASVKQAAPDHEGTTGGASGRRVHPLSLAVDHATHRRRGSLHDGCEKRVGSHGLLPNSHKVRIQEMPH